MAHASSVDRRWSKLLASLPSGLDLDTTARAAGALRRRRRVADAASLLRLALGYGPGGLSLRGAAAWAELTGVASLSDVAVLKRLRAAADWLGQVAGAVLTARLASAAPTSTRRVRLIDATTISPSRSEGTVWRLHASYDPQRPGFDDLQLTDRSGGEHLERHAIEPDDLIIADRGYARGRGIRHVVESGGDIVVRSGWRTQKMWQPGSRRRFTVPGALAALRAGEIADIDVEVDRCGIAAPLILRFIAVRKSDEAVEAGHKRVRHRACDKGTTPDPRTFVSAEHMIVLTSLPRDTYSPERILMLYRLRWQVELAFKRLKSLLRLDRLPARDTALARSWIYAHLIAALLVDDMTQDLLDSPPCAPDERAPARLAVAHP